MNFIFGYTLRSLVTSETIILSVTLLFSLYLSPAEAGKFDPQYSLPVLATQEAERDERNRLNALANMTLSAGKALGNTTDRLALSDSTAHWIISQLGTHLSQQLALHGVQLLKDYGQPCFTLKSGISHHFAGSDGSLFKPLFANPNNIWYSQFNLKETDPGLLASVGLGRRWSSHDWIFGYNAFVDHLFVDDHNRATFGSELWSDYLLVSANYFSPLNDWRSIDLSHQKLMSHGFEFHTRGMLPFYRQVSLSVGWQYYLDDVTNGSNNVHNYRNPESIEVGFTYRPIQILTLTALHKKFLGGEYKNQLGIQLNYQFGVDFSKQLSVNRGDGTNKYALNYYVAVNRYAVPDLPYQSQQSFQVYLATKTVQVHPGQSLALRMMVTPSQKNTQLHWQGDTGLLSLTPPANKNKTQDWTVIMPTHQQAGDHPSDYSLAVVVDNGNQQVRSNTLHFSLGAFNN